MSCQRASELISASMERRLSLRERLSLRFHLLMCSACRTFRRQLLAIRAAMRRTGEPLDAQVTPDGAVQSLSPDARQRIEEAIRRM